MPEPTLDLLIDASDNERDGRLVEFTSAGRVNSVPLFCRQDGERVRIRFARPSSGSSRLHDYLETAGGTFQLAIGDRLDAPPTAGTWQLAFEGTSTGMTALAFDVAAASLQTLLRTVTADAALTVTLLATGIYQVAWSAAGAQDLLTSDSDLKTLTPEANVIISRYRTGTASIPEIQTISLVQAAPVFQDSWSALSTSTTPALVNPQDGSAAANEIYVLSLPELAYAGSLSLTATAWTRAVSSIVAGVATCTAAHTLRVGQKIQFSALGTPAGGIAINTTYYVASIPSALTFTFAATSGGDALAGHSAASGTLTTIAESVAFAHTRTAELLQSDLEALTAIGSGNVLVTGADGGPYTIELTGERANLAFALTAADVSLAVAPGLEGNLPLSTFGMFRAFAATTAATLTRYLEVRAKFAGETYARVVLQIPVTVARSVINLANLVPSGSATYLSEAETDARYLPQTPLTALTGGAATALDAILTVGQSNLLRWVNDATEGFGLWHLIAGTTAESAAGGIVRPDDYHAVTNAKIWIKRL